MSSPEQLPRPERPTAVLKWEEFLQSESIPLNATVTGALVSIGGGLFTVAAPPLDLHCSSERCLRTMAFDGKCSMSVDSEGGAALLYYHCRHCGGSMQVMGVALLPSTPVGSGAYPIAEASLFGVFPPRGPRVPPRLQKLFGEDRGLFMKGRTAEAHGFGLGAYAYYRRVVENQRDRLIDAIIGAARKAGADDVVPHLETAKREQQFTKSIELLRDAFPRQLYIEGHNPFTLLHGPLSSQLHAGTDEEALAMATAIRTVLSALVEKIADVMKEHSGLTDAINKLQQFRSRPTTNAPTGETGEKPS